jgi:60 kDa SS-A/Ro ribonucleoprotein
MKMIARRTQLQSSLGKISSKETTKEIHAIPAPDTVNLQGCSAYALSDELRLISLLNTVKLAPQYYRNENEMVKELRNIIERLALKDPYFVAQAIVYSRCIGEGMRSINHLAAALLAPFISGEDYAKRFYGPFNRTIQGGGCIYRPDDMKEIKDVYSMLSFSKLTNAMKRGFATAIEGFDKYQLVKYKKSIIDISNLVHPNSTKSNATFTYHDGEFKVLDALMKGITVPIDTWEVKNTKAGQEVADKVIRGELSKEEAKDVLAKAKNDNWESLLLDGKLGILAALRNICNMLKTPKDSVIEALCDLISNGALIKAGKIMPYQIDYAYEMVKMQYATTSEGRKVLRALELGYERAVPNLAEDLPGRTCVMIDCSGSMHYESCYFNGNKTTQSTPADKAGLIGATIAKATNADIVRFGSDAEFISYDPNDSVFTLGKDFVNVNMGGTSIATAFKLITDANKKYDRIIILSDNECNMGLRYSSESRFNWTDTAYAEYVRNVTSPYVYCVDFAAYGTAPLRGDKVNYYFGYGMQMFKDIVSKEFNPLLHIEKVRAVVI